MAVNKFQKVLIANRGEISCRIIKTCARMGIATAAVYSDIDRESLFMKAADEAICIGRSGIDTYLDQDRIIEAVRKSKACAIHPGYGLLSENPAFASRCRDEGIAFIGPSPEAIAAMGSKTAARGLCEKAGVPVIPGFAAGTLSPDELGLKASHLGYPILIKAAAGGGGIGIFLVEVPAQFSDTLQSARDKSMAVYGTSDLLIEKYMSEVRHIEFQILGDLHGNVLHCFERECSLQRRHQKLVEESPSPVMTGRLRKIMGDAAVAVARAVNYSSAGTVEFVLARDGSFYFLEMNTRLQVEHPVTEAVTGIDLVELQIRIAEGERLPLRQDELSMNGHAIECRIYAEDPDRDFNPSAGKLLVWRDADRARTDGGVESSSRITIDFDPLLAKVITHADSRHNAIRKMHSVLKNTVALGITTNIDFLARLIVHEAHIRGEITTDFFEKNPEAVARQGLAKEEAHLLAAAGVAVLYDDDERSGESGWKGEYRASQYATFRIFDELYSANFHKKDGSCFEISIQNDRYDLILAEKRPDSIRIIVNGRQQKLHYAVAGERVFLHSNILGHHALQHLSRFHSMEFQALRKGTREAPMDGKISSVRVRPGETVKKGQELIVMESMKMENIIHAGQAGTVREIYISPGDFVTMGKILIEIDTENLA